MRAQKVRAAGVLRLLGPVLQNCPRLSCRCVCVRARVRTRVLLRQVLGVEGEAVAAVLSCSVGPKAALASCVRRHM